MSEQLWCPTRGYFVIGAGGGPSAGRPSGEASPSEAPPPAGEVASTAADTAPAAASVSAGDAGPGSRVWAPTRGYFTIGGGASKPAAPAKPAAQPKPAAAAPAAASAPSTPAPKAAAAAPPKVAVAAKKEPAKPAGKKEAPAASKKEAAPDPEVVSVTRVPGLTEVAAFREIGKIVYDDPDSETTLYRVPTLNIAFSILSLILLVAIIAVIWQDYDRTWKRIQKDFRGELLLSYRELLHETSAKSFEKLAALEPPLVQMAEKVGAAVPNLPAVPADSNANSYDEIDYRRFRSQAHRIERLVALVAETLERDPEYVRLAKASSAAANAAHMADSDLRYKRGEQQAFLSMLRIEKEHVIAEHDGVTPSASRELEKIDQEYARNWALEVDKLVRAVEEARIAADEAKAAWLAYEEERTRVDGDPPVTLSSVRAALAELEQPISVQEGQIAGVEGSLANKLRDAVLLDAFAPTVTIRKVVIDDLTETLNFLDVPRVDRCETCHINITAVEPRFDDFESHKWGSVYQPHPRPDLYLQDTSPHPYLQFGCTGCHYGDGRATDFIVAAHMPDDEEQEKEWETRFHWHKKHHQVQPMRREKHLTGSCRKCHSDEDYVDGADELNLGLETVRTFGCFGCHRIENFDVIVGEPQGPEDLWKRHKVGPNLRYIADKTTPEFLYKWIRDPQHFRPSTRMPRFFDLSNTSGTMHVVQSDGSVEPLDFDVRNGVEALALATYLHDTSGSRNLAPPEIQGDPTRGRDLVASLGCLGCHSIKAESVRPDTPPLAELREAAPRLARALRDRALEVRRTAGDSSAQAQLANRYEEIGGALIELSRWFERLLPHRDLEGLYSSVRGPLYRARSLEERLGVGESPLAEVETIASAFYDHWAHNAFAPDLSTIGSKFDLESEAGRQRAVAWLTDWIVDPTRHNPETVMPRFRFESDVDGEQHVADIAAYLLTLRDPEFEAAEALTPETLDEKSLVTLRELTFDFLRAGHSTARAQELSRSMPVDDQLRFVGHRLVRRYGCFGCHNGIADIDLDPTKAATELVDVESVPTFDHAQPIGTELSTWGDKDVNRLDYGPWGHQPDGAEAIAHDRKDWLAAKLSDTRRFDVFPVPKWVDKAEERRVYVPTKRLIQKRPDELLIMPLFPFHDEPEVVDAVVTFVTSLVADKIPLTKRKVLDGEERDIEIGSRLVRKYNCLGCHRIGAETRTVALSELPSYTDLHDEDSRRAEWQKETWLARDFEVKRPLPSASNASASLTVPKGMLLNIPTLDPIVDRDSPRAALVDPVNVAQLVHRHYDPLPAFAQSVLQVLDEYADAEVVDPDVSEFVSGALAAAPGTNRFTEFLARVRKAAFEETNTPYGAMLSRLFDRPYDPAVVDWLATPEGEGEIWADLASEFYGRRLQRFSARNQRIPVRGLNEGSIRYYFGTDAESRSNAPPPLVRQGERVRADWLFRFLLDVHPIRPWLKIRMPSFTFTQDEARAIVAWFRSLSDLPNGSELFEADRFVEAEAKLGRDLFRTRFECSKCHPTGDRLPTLPLLAVANGVEPSEIPVTAPSDSYFLAIKEPSGRVVVQGGFPDAESAEAEGRKLSEGTPWSVGEPWSKSNWGPDLSLAAARLRPDWLFDWLMSPKDFMPGTKMPHFFGERERFSGEWDSHLVPERRAEIRALIQYLVHMQRVDGGDIAPLGGGG